jgi:hypothetical protein
VQNGHRVLFGYMLGFFVAATSKYIEPVSEKLEYLICRADLNTRIDKRAFTHLS